MKYKTLVFFVSAFLLFLSLTGCGNSSSAAANPTLPIQTARVAVNGKVETILTDSRGFALYYYTSDTTTTSACTGDCASDWPPLLQKGSAVLGNGSFPGALTVQKTDNGKQIEYKHHLLYTFVSDTAPGQVTGDHDGNWFVAIPDES